MVLAIQILRGRAFNHCHSIDIAMGMGVNYMQHTIASLRQLQTMGSEIHLLFRDQFDKIQQTKKGWLRRRWVWQTDNRDLVTDVIQEEF